MQFSSRTDIAAPIEAVYAALVDFDGWEAAARTKGATLSRQGALESGLAETNSAESGLLESDAVEAGVVWDLAFPFRGKAREGQLTLTELLPGKALTFTGEGKSVGGEVRLELTALSPTRTRLFVQSDLRAKSLGARLFLQSLRLAKARVQAKLNKRLAQFGHLLQTRYAAKR